MSKVLDTVLLLALPASGKSEVRHYLDGLTHEQCVKEFGMGETLQLDDYPYVHFMHRIDDELYARGWDYVFYQGPNRPFINEFEWGTLIELLNEDYRDLMENNITEVHSAANHLFDRIDAAREVVGISPELGEVPYRIRMDVAAALEEEIREELDRKNAVCAQDRKGKTVVIEAARGGPNGAAYPLTPPHGYEYSLGRFSNEILDSASILYVWVTPEDSRRKNIERGRPDEQGSILHHSVPMEVMLAQYGCDDMEYLIGKSEKNQTVTLNRLEVVEEAGEKHYRMKTWHLPVGRFDNRKDLTSFLRKDKKDWEKAEVDAIHNGLKAAFTSLTSKL
ncbi:hypothetical protein KKF84_13250 [Myxococcota bacterium]|nr:hypothetical protein [Myxococcota bacterium]MBU1536285.1 hypothetical protein [Myxococcota bacterium]